MARSSIVLVMAILPYTSRAGLSSNPECIPAWKKAGNTCPYGRSLPFDVTLPNDPTILDYICVIYGYIPFVVAGFVFLEFLWKRSTRTMSIGFFCGLITLLNEFLIKQNVSQPRPGFNLKRIDDYGIPYGSCAVTCGMPSSHSTMAIGFLTVMLLDATLRVVPDSQVIVDHEFAGNDIRGRPTSEVLEIETNVKKCYFTCTPLWPRNTLTHTQAILFGAVWILILSPVPLTRVMLHDHTDEQVFIGGALGFLYGLLYFGIVYVLMQKFAHLAGKKFLGGLITNDYYPPRFTLVRKNGELRMVSAFAEAEDSSYSEGSSSEA